MKTANPFHISKFKTKKNEPKKIAIRVQAILPMEVYKKAGIKLVERNESWQQFISDQCRKLAGDL